MQAKRYKIRSSVAVVLVIFFTGMAAIGVHASEPCQKFIQRVVYKAAPHFHSKDTLLRWAKWNKEHPNYHPPKRRRSLTPEETASKFNFACVADPEPVLVSSLLPMTPPPEISFNPAIVTVSTAPEPTPAPVSLVNPPVNTPPVNVGDVPEPQSWLFMATGVAFLFGAIKWQKRLAYMKIR